MKKKLFCLIMSLVMCFTLAPSYTADGHDSNCCNKMDLNHKYTNIYDGCCYEEPANELNAFCPNHILRDFSKRVYPSGGWWNNECYYYIHSWIECINCGTIYDYNIFGMFEDHDWVYIEIEGEEGIEICARFCP